MELPNAKEMLKLINEQINEYKELNKLRKRKKLIYNLVFYLAVTLNALCLISNILYHNKTQLLLHTVTLLCLAAAYKFFLRLIDALNGLIDDDKETIGKLEEIKKLNVGMQVIKQNVDEINGKIAKIRETDDLKN
ncbi:hypothetical protein AAGG74_17540 [Bacillus mexicanus]|uniref:hypothetical protein n=1 Tax=Bacillus mexicanus TaxID=2834415 RepID=UPI003D25C20A